MDVFSIIQDRADGKFIELQPVLPRGVLDWKDVISTPLSGLLSVLIFVVIRRFVRDPPAQGQDAAQEGL